jgi:ribonuclease PH
MRDRPADQLRPISIQRHFTGAAPGSVLISAGRTTVLCTASVEASVPKWLEGKGRGWVTAEYNMLPGSTSPRKPRERTGKVDGRTSEIQRLVGRSLRAIIDLTALGERTIAIDCDVLEADGGTRTLSVTGALVALVDALRSIEADLPDPARWPLGDSVAAISVGMVDGQMLLDLDYSEDSKAAVDMNVVMAGNGRFIEVQGTGEQTTFSEEELTGMLRLARQGIGQLTAIQREALGPAWPWK